MSDKCKLTEKCPSDPLILSDIQNPNTVERFFKFIQPVESGCHLWMGHRNANGYGIFSLSKASGGKPVRAHRVAWAVAGKSLDSALDIDHVCRTRACVHVHPDHLDHVTNKENVLRGDGPSALNARKTACPDGHPYSVRNTYTAKNGKKHCRICAQRRQRSGRAAVSKLEQKLYDLNARLQNMAIECGEAQGNNQRLQQQLKQKDERIQMLSECLEEARTALNNVATIHGHESLILRKHPEPCRHLDFCVMKDAVRRLEKIDRALSQPPDGKAEGG